MKKVIKYFFIFLFSAFIMLLVSNNEVSANYDPSKNYTTISVTNDGVTITVHYQRGFENVASTGSDPNTATYMWCKSNQNYDKSQRCNDGTVVKFVEKSGGNTLVDYNIAKGSSDYVDSNVTTVTYFVPKDKDPFLSKLRNTVSSAGDDVYYTIFVTTYFCQYRNSNGQDSYSSCKIWDVDNGSDRYITKLNINIYNLLANTNYDNIEDKGIKTVIQQITDITYNIVLPVIWALLGVLLVVKGSIVGAQIVKSADEPQVRQEKIGSLKWFVIGIAIAYGATGVIKLLENVIKRALKM